MITRTAKVSILLCVFVANLCILQTNASDIVINAESDRQNVNPLVDKYRMFIPKGKPRTFDNEEEYNEAKKILDKKILSSHAAVVGHFDEASKSDFVEKDSYPGGGYYLFDFSVARDLKNPETPAPVKISVRVPYDFVRLSDQEYLNEIQDSMNELLSEAMSYKKKYTVGEITASELSAYNDEWEIKISPMKYVYHFSQRIRRGSDFSLSGNEYALFLDETPDGTYVFRPNGIYPIGRGSFVDILLHSKH